MLGGPRQRAVLALLLSAPNRTISIHGLIDEIWGEEAGEGTIHVLQTYVSSLRRLLGPGRIESVGHNGYMVRLGPDELDATHFADAIRRGCALVATEPAQAEKVLTRALQLWRGQPYADVDPMPRLVSEGARLEELRLTAVEQRNEAALRRGGRGTLIADLRAAIAESPLRERSRIQLMVALYRDGRQTEALAEYRAFRALLALELGLDPSPELQRLEQRILIQDPSLERIDPRPLGNLPSPITRFIGRQADLDGLEVLLAGQRLLTLTGVAGVGKSRLALELAHRMASRFDDGAWWVDLAPVSEPSRVPFTVANALGVGKSTAANVHGRLTSFVQPRNQLLVLDNCEHLAKACAEVAELLLAASAKLKLIATSRVPLRLTGENRRRVPPLALPDPGHDDDPAAVEAEAVRLFLDRARAVGWSQELGPASQATVVAICRRLDGIPLALELAGARMSSLSAEQILLGLADRFAMLIGEDKTARTADATLREALDWSYELLTLDEQAFFRDLGVFVGGFTPEAAVSIAGDRNAPPERRARLLERLVEKSVVEPRAAGESGGRHRLLESLRDYALERLDEAGDRDSAAARHAGYFRQLASRAEADLMTAGRHAAVSRVEADLENLEAALEWSVAHEAPARAFESIRAAVEAWHNRGALSTAQHWVERLIALEATDVPGDIRARALTADGLTALYQGDYRRAGGRLEAAIALFREAGDERRLAEALGRRGQVAVVAGDIARSSECVTESLALYDRLGDRLGPAWPLEAAGTAAVIGGDWRPEVDRQLETASRLFEELRDPTGQSLVLCLRSVLAGRTGDPVAALRYATEMVMLSSRDEERLTRPLALTTLALANLARDLVTRDVERAEGLARQAILVALDVGSLHDIGLALAPLAWATLELGEPERAARLLGAAQQHSAMVRSPLMQSILEPAVGEAVARLGIAGFEAACAAGRGLALDEAARFGLRTDSPSRERVPTAS